MAMRALKRRQSKVVSARILADQNRRDQTPAKGSGGQRGNDTVSSAVGSQPRQSLRHIPVATTRSTTPRGGGTG
ncbi:MAG: hypothetical protein WCG47_29655 [Dermatophilaceae bacterium]